MLIFRQRGFTFPSSVRLFPLPTVVFFPGTFLPLHVFEIRYRQLVRDAMSDDRMIAVALLRPGFEADYHENPPVHEIAGLGRIAQVDPLPDGRSNIVLQGLLRIRVGEVIRSTPYRTVRATPVPEQPSESTAQEQIRLAAKLFGLYGTLVEIPEQPRKELERLLVDPHGLGPLADLIAATTNFAPAEHQALLEEPDPIRRAKRLVHLLREKRTLMRILEPEENRESDPDAGPPPPSRN